MTKQQTIDRLTEQIKTLQSVLEIRTTMLEDAQQKIDQIPEDIYEKQYQNFKESDLAKHIARYVDELISENLRIDGDHESKYSGYYSLKLEYKDKLISDFNGHICMHRNYLDD